MSNEHEIKVNARGLSAPGPRWMVKTALAKHSRVPLRVVVSDIEAVNDLAVYLSELNLISRVDQIGEEYHVIIQFEDS